jgi:hypothetical protein
MKEWEIHETGKLMFHFFSLKHLSFFFVLPAVSARLELEHKLLGILNYLFQMKILNSEATFIV